MNRDGEGAILHKSTFSVSQCRLPEVTHADRLGAEMKIYRTSTCSYLYYLTYALIYSLIYCSAPPP